MSDQILLVDDDLDLLDSFTVSLGIRGFHTITATNGLEAINAYKKACPCIVFMDIKMPEMDGYEAFSKIKEQFPDAKIILVTGNEIIEKSKDAKKNGLIGILSKPVTVEEIISTIKENNC